jgi:hypothetical protein
MIGVKFDSSVLERKFTALEKSQLPFATALTLTWTARDMQSAIKAAMPAVYDRPTRFTVEGVFIRAATKSKLEAYVFLRDEAFKGTAPVKYLVPTVYGGHRKPKRFELALRAAGILGPGELTVFGSGAKLNAYGNVPGSKIGQILSRVGGQRDSQQNVTDSRRSVRKRKQNGVFVPGVNSSLPRGIWERSEVGIKPIFLFVDESSVNYGKLFNFVDIGEQAFRRSFRKNWELALKYAVKNAR